MPEDIGGGDGVKKFIIEPVSKDEQKKSEQPKNGDHPGIGNFLSEKEINGLLDEKNKEQTNSSNKPDNSDVKPLSQEEQEEINNIRKKIGIEEQPMVEEKVEKEGEKRYNPDMAKENFNGGNSGGGNGSDPENGQGPENNPKNKVLIIKSILVDVNFLNPNKKQSDEMSNNLDMIGVVLGHEFKDINKINEIINDFEENKGKGTYSEVQYEQAKEDKGILSESAILAVREMRQNRKIYDGDLLLGSKHIDNMLPTKLKFLGKEISKSFISNEEIDKQLNILEFTRQNTDFNNPDSVETLVQKINTRIDKLRDKDYENEKAIGEQDTALTMLNREKRKLIEVVDESKIEANKTKNMHDNAYYLIKNGNVLIDGGNENEKSKIAAKVFDKFGRNYISFKEMVYSSGDPMENQKIILGDIDSLVNSVYIAVNMSKRGNDLATNSMTAEQIDAILPKQFKGLGIYVKDIDSRLTDEDRNAIIETNRRVTAVIKDKTRAKFVFEKIIENIKNSPEDSSKRQYDELALEYMSEKLGFRDKRKIENKGDIDNEGNYSTLDYEPPRRNEKGEWEGGSRWELAPEYAAMAMKFMDHDMRWQPYTPPEWYKELDAETQYRIDVMIAINETAAGLGYAGKDLEKIFGNRTEFSFSHEKMNKLYNEDFTLVESKVLHDLCEFYTDQNGISCLRYKEKFYKYDYDKEEFIFAQVPKRDKDGAFILDKDGNRQYDKRKIEIEENEANAGLGVRTIDQDVFDKLDNVMDYKEDLARFLAERPDSKYTWETHKKDDPDGTFKKGDFVLDDEGNKVPHWMNKMNAYTVWNKVFGMGDTSIWDRMRSLPTWDGVISDGVRTLNPEYKSKAKWQLMKSGKLKRDLDLIDFEFFGGNIADYVSKVMVMERDLAVKDKNGRVTRLSPITGKETLREKLLNGRMRLLSAKTFYGMNEFVNEGRDLKKGSGRSLAKVVMDYATFNRDGSYEVNGNKVEFRPGQTTFMNEFRDSMEASIKAYQYMMGKSDTKDLNVWARDLKDKLGMLNGITWDKEIDGINVKLRPFSYTRDPAFWRDVMVATYGADMNRLSTDHISINNPRDKDGSRKSYSFYIHDLLKETLAITNTGVNLQETMKLLGVSINNNESGESQIVRTKTEALEKAENIYTNQLNNLQNKMIAKKESFDYKKLEPFILDVKKANKYPKNSEFEDLMMDFERALKTGDINYVSTIAKAIESFQPYIPNPGQTVSF